MPRSDSYRAPWWLRLGGRHWQTIYGRIVERFLPAVPYRPNVRWPTPRNDDFIELAWVGPPADPNGDNLYVLFHGLEGDKDSHYARILMAAVVAQGDRGVVVHFRGCGKNPGQARANPNLLPRSYHSADSDEIDWVLRRMRRDNPASRIFVTGYSLGAAALLRWLGEPQRNSHQVINRAAAISAPIDLAVTARAVSRGFSLLYSCSFLGSLKPKCVEKLSRFGNALPYDSGALRRVRTLYQFDDVVTGPVHGFRDAANYHARGSAGSGLRNITVPTLIVTAQNDPVVPRESTQDLQVSAAVTLERPTEGGHAGFYCGPWPGVANWLPERLRRHFCGLPNGARMLPKSGWLGLMAGALSDGLVLYALRSPRLLRTLAGVLRRHWPTLQLGALTVVARARDVREVLERSDDFLLGPINEGKMFTGDFVLSLDPGPQYQREKILIRNCLAPGRIGMLQEHAERAAQAWLARPRQRNRLDAVEFAEYVTVQIAHHFWGLNPQGAQSRVVQARVGEETMQLWLRKLAAVITSREPAAFGLRESGLACRDEFMRFVRQACERRAQDMALPEDVIGHFVWLEGDLEVVTRNVASLIVAGSAVVTKGFAHALEQLLLNREARARALAVATDSRLTTDEQRTQVMQLMAEALRFAPVFPVLARRAPRNTRLAAGTPREVEIPADSLLYIAPIGAMFDPEAVEEPDNFAYTRFLELNPAWSTATGPRGGAGQSWRSPYMFFGGGTHWCVGDQMALTEIAAMGLALLRLPELRLARRLRYDGLAAASLVVEYGA